MPMCTSGSWLMASSSSHAAAIDAVTIATIAVIITDIFLIFIFIFNIQKSNFSEAFFEEKSFKNLGICLAEVMFEKKTKIWKICACAVVYPEAYPFLLLFLFNLSHYEKISGQKSFPNFSGFFSLLHNLPFSSTLEFRPSVSSNPLQNLDDFRSFMTRSLPLPKTRSKKTEAKNFSVLNSGQSQNRGG